MPRLGLPLGWSGLLAIRDLKGGWAVAVLSCLMTMMMVCDAGWVSKRGQLLFYVHFVRERVKRYYGIWNKVTKYWEEIDLCVYIVCIYRKRQKKGEEKNPTHVYWYLRRGNVFFFGLFNILHHIKG